MSEGFIDRGCSVSWQNVADLKICENPLGLFPNVIIDSCKIEKFVILNRPPVGGRADPRNDNIF